MNAYKDRREELSRGRRWAPFAVLKPEAIELAIALLEIEDGDEVIDLGCDLHAFSDMLRSTHPEARIATAFDLAGEPYPTAEAGLPPDAVELATRALGSRQTHARPKAFGTFVDKVSRDAEAAALSELGFGSHLRWGRLAGVLLASALSTDGKAVVVVHAGDLEAAALSEARRFLISSGIIEHVVLLPQDSMVGRRVTTALLVLSRENESLRITDLRDLSLAREPRLGKDPLGVASLTERVSTGNPAVSRLVAARELADGPCVLGSSLLANATCRFGRMRLDDIASVSIGADVARITEIVSGAQIGEEGSPDIRWARVVGPSDFLDGELVRAEDLADGGKYAPLSAIAEDKILQPGDIVVPRSGSVFAASVIENDRAPEGATRLVASKNMLVIRPFDGFDPFFIAALLDSPQGVRATLRGGPIRHTGVRDIAALALPEECGSPEAMTSVSAWYRKQRSKLLNAREAYLRARETLEAGLADMAALAADAASPGRAARDTPDANRHASEADA